MIIRGSSFRNNSGGRGALVVSDDKDSDPLSVVTLEGCIRFVNNSPIDIARTFVRPKKRGSCPKPETKPKPTPVPTPTPSTCLNLPDSIVVSGISSGTQCQQLDAGGIGISSIVESGFIDAVDIWSYLGAGVEVCFRNSGALIFLDAATSPRALMSMTGYSVAGMTCSWVERPGSVVLVPGPAPAPLPPAAEQLHDCSVTTTDILNFRQSPGGNILQVLPANITLTALSRTADWFQVDFYGAAGWISADYVIMRGNCG